MERKEIETSVIEILKKYARRKEVWEDYTMQSSILEDLKVNSARFVDIVLDIEDEFEIEIEDEDMDKIVTIEDLANIVAEKVN